MKQDRDQLIEVLDSVYVPLLKALTDDPDNTHVEYDHGETTLIVRIKTPKSEIGKILGIKGRTINGLRTVLYRLSGKFRVRTILEVQE